MAPALAGGDPQGKGKERLRALGGYAAERLLGCCFWHFCEHHTPPPNLRGQALAVLSHLGLPPTLQGRCYDSASPMGKLRSRFFDRGHKATMSRQGDGAWTGHGQGSCGQGEFRLQLLTKLLSGLAVLTCKAEGMTPPRGGGLGVGVAGWGRLAESLRLSGLGVPGWLAHWALAGHLRRSLCGLSRALEKPGRGRAEAPKDSPS